MLRERARVGCLSRASPSHGTSDSYSWRARLRSRLMAEKGSRFVDVEGDRPDYYRVNR